MSGRKRRDDQLAPALFPFMAVLLCLIGALVLILSITVTNSHASARKDAEMVFAEMEGKENLAESISEGLLNTREASKQELEKRREALQHVEDHLRRLQEELTSLHDKLKRLESEDFSDQKEQNAVQEQADALRRQIDAKKAELAAQVDALKKKKPAFAIIPYSGRNGTSRRPIYLECRADGIYIQPEGVLIEPKDMFPPGPSNPLASALRMLRNRYEESDRAQGLAQQAPYPLLMVRPDGVETYAIARKAIESWDDQFGYELIDAEMELAFPPSVPGTKELLQQVVDSSKQRQRALLAANPKLAREYALALDNWDEMDGTQSSGSNPSRGNAGGSNSSFNMQPIEDAQNWSMVKPIPAGTSPSMGASGNHTSSAQNRSQPIPNQAVGTVSEGSLAVMQGGAPSSSFEQSVATNGSASQFSLDAGSQQLNNNGALEGQHNSTGGLDGGDAQNSQNAGAGTSFTNQAANNQPSPSNPSSMGGGGAPTAGSMSNPATQNPEQGEMQPAIPSANIQLGEKSNKYVKPEGDLKPISVGAGKNWAQAKAEGKATPVSRTIQIVAINSKWLIRSEQDPKQFDRVILLDNGPKQVSDELADAIRGRVDSWGLSLPGGYWVPLVVVESASDAQTSVARLERLLEGSGVDLRVVPLTIPK
jgi:Skp family chaperone for outer membrane proteins